MWSLNNGIIPYVPNHIFIWQPIVHFLLIPQAINLVSLLMHKLDMSAVSSLRFKNEATLMFYSVESTTLGIQVSQRCTTSQTGLSHFRHLVSPCLHFLHLSSHQHSTTSHPWHHLMLLYLEELMMLTRQSIAIWHNEMIHHSFDCGVWNQNMQMAH